MNILDRLNRVLKEDGEYADLERIAGNLDEAKTDGTFSLDWIKNEATIYDIEEILTAVSNGLDKAADSGDAKASVAEKASRYISQAIIALESIK